MDIENLLKRELLKELGIYVNEIEDMSVCPYFMDNIKIDIVYKGDYVAALEVQEFNNGNIAIVKLSYGLSQSELIEELNLFGKLEKTISTKSSSILSLSANNTVSAYYQTVIVRYKTNNFNQYYMDIADRLSTLLDTTPVLDGYLLTMANSGLVEIECSILGESPLIVVIADRKISNIEEKVLENILKRIQQYCLQYSFRMVKSSKSNVINIAYTEEKKSIDVETVVDKFLNKPIEDIAPGDE